MKSTGLFGKNSGRVGGVVYSNFRGEQIVRSYQPKVSNPNAPGQVAQRAKFKLVSQVSASLGKEIGISFVPSVQKQTPRNAFLKKMLTKTTYSNNQASLPIEDIVLTNSSLNGFAQIQATTQTITGAIATTFASPTVKVRVVVLAYNDGGEIVNYSSFEPVVQGVDVEGTTAYAFQWSVPELPQIYASYRAVIYAYDADSTSDTTYQDYEVLSSEATLSDIRRRYTGNLRFSESMNIVIPRNV